MSDFNSFWNQYVCPLQGEDILTATGKLNTISSVTNDYVERISSNGKRSKINKSFFSTVYNDLLLEKLITRTDINKRYGKRCSSIVSVVLEKFPNVELERSPVIKLKIK